jgi:hypothetical protein
MLLVLRKCQMIGIKSLAVYKLRSFAHAHTKKRKNEKTLSYEDLLGSLSL